MTHNSKPAALLESLISRAKSLGADAADAVFFDSSETRSASRKGVPETIELAESSITGLRVWVGKRQALASSTDLSSRAINELAERVVSMARVSTEDADSRLAPAARLASSIPKLDIFDGTEPTPAWLEQQCREAEETALAVKGITNSEGAEAAYSTYSATLATSGGFTQSYQSSHFSVSVSVLAGTGTNMERDYEFASCRHRADLPAAAGIGKEAAARTLRRLNPRKVNTASVPVIFDPRVSRSLLSCFSGAINGSAIARGTSFLKDALGKPVFAGAVNIMDDPHRLRGLSSRPFDGEGVAGRRIALVENGVLKSWLLDVRTANKLQLETTGHASRGAGSPPSPGSSNLYMEPGGDSPAALIGSVKSGFYVTETFGMGINLVTGDYSQGASGFWIENGKLAYPVSEVTIAGQLKDMFTQATPANDLEFRYGTNAPTLHIARMTVAGT